MTNKQKRWFALDVTVEPAASEAIEFAFNQLDSRGTQIDEMGKRNNDEIEIVGYFDERPPDDTVQGVLTEALRIYGFSPETARKTRWRTVKDQDWLAEWKKYWKPTQTGGFIIAPPWEKVEKSGKIVIRIEPNMAFGTGTHQTTRLCLRAIEEHYSAGMSFLDVGTGTGILAIAASKIAAEKQFNTGGQDQQDASAAVPSASNSARILGFDTDEDSVRIARENAVLNSAEGTEIAVGSVSETTPPFDFICANLTADVILPMLPTLVRKARKVLVLSGILVEQEESVAQNLRTLGVEDFSVNVDGEWIAIVVARTDA